MSTTSMRTVPHDGAKGRGWRIRTPVAALLCLAFGAVVSCGDPGGSSADDTGDVEEAGADEAAGEDDVRDVDDGEDDVRDIDDGDDGDPGDESDACDPGCHWDCFGGATCVAGEVWEYGYAPRPCCHFGDPWPGSGPVCGWMVLYRCAEGTCEADSRYVSCGYVGGPAWSETYPHIAPTFCPEGWGRVEGDSCSTDDDCRPVAEGAAPRLRCDTSSSTCVSEDRPEAPDGFGTLCGLTAADHADQQHDGWEILVEGATCDACFAAWSEPGSCWRQACTTRCRFDEDCPEGTVCLCPRWNTGIPGQFCAAATGRETAEGRSAGLVCP